MHQVYLFTPLPSRERLGTRDRHESTKPRPPLSVSVPRYHVQKMAAVGKMPAGVAQAKLGELLGGTEVFEELMDRIGDLRKMSPRSYRKGGRDAGNRPQTRRPYGRRCMLRDCILVLCQRSICGLAVFFSEPRA
jgi:hypothetical protein